ncbi:MAG: ABC transporter ATP-binding protein [Candidatus Electrothrix sp. GM3_4]|nr:ABC transporter ATP-binding protein [Candidatus Electrothrix sp. GM3_4]
MTVIKIENLWKEYRLGVIGYGTLTHDLQSWWAKVRGKEDPNSKIAPMLAGQGKRIDGDSFWALRDINLEVKQGEILGIIGGNGAGKSTLLKILSRVTAPTSGDIKVKGRVASLLEVGTGFHPELTGRENIFMNGAIFGMSKQELRGKVDEIIDFSGVEDYINTPVKRYSSGMYVRLAFAVAAHLEPEILVVDEVLAVGDLQFQKKCLGKMKDVSQEGRTVLLVSHNMSSLRALSTQGVEFSEGEIVNFGTATEVISSYIRGNMVSGRSCFKQDLEKEKKDSKLKLLEAFIQNNKKKISHLYSFNESITFCAEFRLEVDVPHLRFGIELCDAFGTIVFVSIDTDATNLSGVPRKKGVYKEKVILPATLFLPGEYSINLFAGTPRIERYLKIDDCLTFEIVESDTYLSNVTGEKRAGFIGTPLEWEVKSAH